MLLISSDLACRFSKALACGPQARFWEARRYLTWLWWDVSPAYWLGRGHTLHRSLLGRSSSRLLRLVRGQAVEALLVVMVRVAGDVRFGRHHAARCGGVELGRLAPACRSQAAALS